MVGASDKSKAEAIEKVGFLLKKNESCDSCVGASKPRDCFVFYSERRNRKKTADGTARLKCSDCVAAGRECKWNSAGSVPDLYRTRYDALQKCLFLLEEKVTNVSTINMATLQGAGVSAWLLLSNAEQELLSSFQCFNETVPSQEEGTALFSIRDFFASRRKPQVSWKGFSELVDVSREEESIVAKIVMCEPWTQKVQADRKKKGNLKTGERKNQPLLTSNDLIGIGPADAEKQEENSATPTAPSVASAPQRKKGYRPSKLGKSGQKDDIKSLNISKPVNSTKESSAVQHNSVATVPQDANTESPSGQPNVCSGSPKTSFIAEKDLSSSQTLHNEGHVLPKRPISDAVVIVDSDDDQRPIKKEKIERQFPLGDRQRTVIKQEAVDNSLFFGTTGRHIQPQRMLSDASYLSSSRVLEIPDSEADRNNWELLRSLTTHYGWDSYWRLRQDSVLSHFHMASEFEEYFHIGGQFRRFEELVSLFGKMGLTVVKSVRKPGTLRITDVGGHQKIIDLSSMQLALEKVIWRFFNGIFPVLEDI